MAKIYVKIYDLFPMNEKLRPLGLGAFHTSITLNGSVEYCFGTGGSFDSSGIESIPIRSNEENGTGFDGLVKLYQVVDMGKAKYSTRECENLISEMSVKDRWKNGSYSTLMHNCNTFTYEFCKLVLPPEQFANYPNWIFRGQNLLKFILKISLSPIIVLFGKQIPFFRPPLDDPDANYADEGPGDIDQQLLRGTAHRIN